MSSIRLNATATSTCSFFSHSWWCLQSFFQWPSLWQKWHAFNEPEPFFLSSLPFLPVTKPGVVCSSWFGLFLISLDKRVYITFFKTRVYLLESMVVTMWLYDYGSELRSINALSSSSILRSTARSSLMTLLKKFRCYNTVLSLRSYVAYIVVSWDTSCWRGFSSYTTFLTLTTIP